MAERHSTDLVSFVTGLLALCGAGLFFADSLDFFEVDVAVVAATAVIVIGLSGLIVSARRIFNEPPG